MKTNPANRDVRSGNASECHSDLEDLLIAEVKLRTSQSHMFKQESHLVKMNNIGHQDYRFS